MRKLCKILLAALAVSLLLALGAYAAPEENTKSFDINVVVNGEDFSVTTVKASAEDRVYTFELAELLDTFGFELSYDEETDVATLQARPDSLGAALFQQMKAEEAVSEEPSAEPSEEPSAEPSEEPSAEPSEAPDAEPSEAPDAEASAEPSEEPAAEASGEPSEEPAAEASGEPSEEPDAEASGEPSDGQDGGYAVEAAALIRKALDDLHSSLNGEPAETASEEPSGEPSGEQIEEPAAEPSAEPSAEPAAEENGGARPQTDPASPAPRRRALIRVTML